MVRELGWMVAVGGALLTACKSNSESATSASPVDEVVAVAAKGESGSAVPLSPLAADIDNICNVIARSGADSAPPGERSVQTAIWLGKNVVSAEGNAFLGQIQPLQGAAKADALEAKALDVGLTGCPLAAEWRK